MFVFLSLLVVISHVVATPDPFSQRIVGGDLTTIDRYPFQAALLYGVTTFSQSGGASILNSRSILTAAHNFGSSENPQNYRIRVGSTFGNSGGTVHAISQIIIHPNYFTATYDSDIAIVRSATVITFNNLVQPAAIAGANYNVADNQAVWATGWGITSFPGSPSEQLRHVQIWTINQEICRSRYAELGFSVTDNMMCSGVLDVGGKDQCTGDSGGPLIHNGVQVGVCSFGSDCGHPRYPGINVRVSRFTNWIQANA